MLPLDEDRVFKEILCRGPRIRVMRSLSLGPMSEKSPALRGCMARTMVGLGVARYRNDMIQITELGERILARLDAMQQPG